MQLDASVVTICGPRAASAGFAYFTEGRTSLMTLDVDKGEVLGTCRGDGRDPYSALAYLDHDASGTIVFAGGDCSCPIGVDCEHVVALYFTALARLTGRSTAPGQPSAPEWERMLGRVFPPTQPTETVSLALAFELASAAQVPARRGQTSPADYATLRIRPLRMGKRGTWIQTGAEWREFQYRGVTPGFRPAQARAMGLLATFLARNDPFFSPGSSWQVLDRYTVFPPWQVLLDAQRAGVPLVEPARGHAPVALRHEPAEAVVDLVEDEHGVLVTGQVALPDGVSLDHVAPIGASAIGAVGRSADGTLTIIGFPNAASPEWSTIRAAGGVRIPPADRAHFERTMLPRITHRVGWRSPDGSFIPAPPAPPVLEFTVDVADDASDPTAAVSVGWRYGAGTTGVRLALAPSPLDPIARDAAAEAATTLSATAVLQTLPALVRGSQLSGQAALAGREVVTLLTEIVPRLAELPHVEVLMVEGTPDFRDLGDPAIRVGLNPGTDWFDLDVSVTVGGIEVPTATLIAALAQNRDTLFLPDGGYVRLDRPELQRLRELLEEARALTDQRSTVLRVSRLRFSWWEELLALGVVDQHERAWIEALHVAATSLEAAPPLPDGVRAELRPYQRDGFGWLARLRRAGLGGVLADDMGLGKTLQSLAMILDARQQHPEHGPFIVVAPTSVVAGWATEAARFTPGLKVVIVTQMLPRRGVPLADFTAGADLIVTSYSLFRLEYDEYAALSPSGLLLDEAQNAKNHQSRIFACAKQLPAPVKFAVTGTPMENNLGELWAMFSIVAPGLLGSLKQFTDHYRGPIEQGAGPDLLDRLRRRIAPFLLRRTKDEVAGDLPSKQEQRIDVELAPSHRRLYALQLQRERQRVLGLVDDLDSNRIEVLSALTRLRQLAIDPALVGTDAEPGSSSKLDALVPLLEEAAAEGHRMLVFSQFTRFLDRIEARLAPAGIAFTRLDGSTRRRAQVVRSFAEGTQPVFLISLKAGGTGLNLAMADYCILTDPWWNPAAEAQAVDRAHRIGQTRPVVVYRLIAKDTIEEKVMALQDHKRKLVSGVIGGGGGGAVSASDIRALLEV